MRRFLSALLMWFSVASGSLAQNPQGTPVDFQRDILPLLSDRCLTCHGPDAATREAGLRLDQADRAMAPLESGSRAIVPGDTVASELIQRITTSDSSLKMPPEDSGKSLSPDEIELLTRWIEQGATYVPHWAFSTIRRPPVPKVKNEGWVLNPIDAFTLSNMEQAGVKPAPPAPRAKLARRIYFDLVGMPPTLAEIDEFAADKRPGAAARLADRLFASPHYGERMAIEWLDGARYADSNGYQNDFARHMWPWRDWVIDAYNRNLPFDQFAIEQIAGDLLDSPTRGQLVATGFNRNNRTVTEAGSIPEEWLVENVVDRVETTAGVFLGLTMGCARCHDHKYDPISQREFYEFFAFFHSVAEQGVYTEQRGNVAPLIDVPSAEQEAELARLEAELAELKPRADQFVTVLSGNPSQWSPLVAAAAAPMVPTWRIAFDGDKVKATNPEGGVRDAGGNQGENAPAVVGPARKFASGGPELTDVFAPEHNRPFSWAVWIKREQGGTLLSKTTGDFKRGLDALLDGDGTLGVRLFHTWPDQALRVATRQPLPKGRWSHVVVTYDGSTKAAGLKIYVNGHLAEGEITHDTLAGSIGAHGPLRVAHGPDGAPLVGQLSDLQLFDQALTGEEARNLLLASLETQVAKRFEQLDAGMKSEGLALAGHALLQGELFKYAQLADRQLAASQQLESLKGTIPTTMIMQDLPEPRATYVLNRGAYDSPDKSQPVTPDVPDFLPPLPEGAPKNRLALAHWIVSRDNPLTARVTVNRLWSRFFGRGLVKTSENFGLQAEAPSHPELLDWLAMELIESGWDLQHIQRLIVTSATYAQSSQATPEDFARDPENRLLARGPRHRFDAELIRDNALALSGLLNLDIGGRSIMPYQPEKLWEELAGGAFEIYTQDHGPLLYRRSLYVYRKRTVPHPTMSTFDAPSWEVCALKRSATDTPLQALALLNDTTYVEAARKFAERMMHEGGSTPEARLAWGFRLATGRPANSRELAVLKAALEKYSSEFQHDPAAVEAILAHGESPLAGDLPRSELASYATVAALVLNLDETITKD